MGKKVIVLSDGSDQVADLVKKLTNTAFQVRLCSSPSEVLQALDEEKPQLLVASGDYQEMSTTRLAEKAYDTRSIPTYLVLALAGEQTQMRLRRHPGIIGVYYSPLDVDRLFDRIQKFFANLGMT